MRDPADHSPPAPAPEAAPAFGHPGTRSSLSLSPSAGEPAPAAAPPEPARDESDRRDWLREGSVRARNMATALAMIVYLLAKAVARRILWGPAQQAAWRALLLVAPLLRALGLMLKPHLDRLRARAEATRHRAFRAVLIAVIKLIGPLEERLLGVLGLARERAARHVARGKRSLSQLLSALGRAIDQALRAGLSRPAVRQLAARLIRILEDG